MQSFLKLTFKCQQSSELDKEMETEGLDVMGYDSKWREYTVRITPKDFTSHKAVLRKIIQKAYEYNNQE